MAETLDPKFLDKRTAERYIRMGLLDEKAHERHLKSLPDVAEKAAPVVTRMFEDEAFEGEQPEEEAAEESSEAGDATE